MNPRTAKPEHEIHAGLMSGTSMDGVDGVLIAFDREGRPVETLATVSLPMPEDLRQQLAGLQSPQPDELAQAARAANALADLYTHCVEAMLDDARLPASAVRAIGAHGQTIRHAPAEGYSLQILNGARLAARTGIPVVADLRSADIALGGQGAPLMPAFHAHVFRHLPGRCGILNLGGIANLSIIEAAPAADTGSGAGPSPTAAPQVFGFDTGPANVLLDAWIEKHQNKRFDHRGEWAASGQPIPALLDALLTEPYFAQPAPKSTGRDLFHLGWLARHLPAGHDWRPEDIQATLLALTAETTASAIRQHHLSAVYVCGGGAENHHLIEAIRSRSGTDTHIDSTSSLGIAPQAVEASGCAWLARQRLHGEAIILQAITGARRNAVLGALHLPPH